MFLVFSRYIGLSLRQSRRNARLFKLWKKISEQAVVTSDTSK